MVVLGTLLVERGSREVFNWTWASKGSSSPFQCEWSGWSVCEGVALFIPGKEQVGKGQDYE
jgi:hypothetical protein